MKAILDLIECSTLDARDPVPLQVRPYEEDTGPMRHPWESAAWTALRKHQQMTPLQLSLAVGCSLSAARVWLDAQLHAGKHHRASQERSDGAEVATIPKREQPRRCGH